MIWNPRLYLSLLQINHSSITFSERARFGGLAIGEDGLDVEAQLSFWRVLPSDDAEPQALLAGPLLEHHRVQGQLGGLGPSGKGADAITAHLESKKLNLMRLALLSNIISEIYNCPKNCPSPFFRKITTTQFLSLILKSAMQSKVL